jgi:hypothetical protein
MSIATAAPSFDRLLSRLSHTLTPEAARILADLRADDKTQARYDLLADKNTAGTLTAAERDELEGLVYASSMIAVMQAKARGVLRKTSKR